jgi:hypothetical protein
MMHFKRVLLLLLALTSAAWAADPAPGSTLKLITPRGYLPQVPLVVWVEVNSPTGAPDRDLWDAQATLSSDNPGVTLSTNRVWLRNGVGSALVTFAGAGNFNLTASLASLNATKSMTNLSSVPVTTIGGTLPGASTTWSGVIRVTNDVTVPVGHTLTVRSNALVLINGVASGTTAADLIVNGTIVTEGTEDHPMSITCSNVALNWGQIRHGNAQPSTYRYTLISKAGRATGEGHTGTAPAIRANNSTVTFERCAISDLTAGGVSIGKVMMADGSDITFRNGILARARMGPEIATTALACTNTWITDMRGPDDCDGIYLHNSGGRALTLSGCVLGFGDDDAIDTLDSVVTVENSIIRDWPNTTEDAKGISAFHGEVRVRRCLIVDCYVGIAAKSGGPQAVVRIDQSTISGILRGVSASFKDNATVGNIDFRITNSIVRSPDAIHTDFGPTNFTIRYSDLSEAWTGTGNITADPLFVSEVGDDYHLQALSPCIDAGDPAAPLDTDGTRTDMGVFPFSGALRVALTSPVDGSFVAFPANVDLTAAAVSTGIISKVEFYAASKLGQDTNAPYTLTWTNPPVGSHALFAVVHDSGGTRATSAPVQITVTASSTITNSLIALGSYWKYLDDGSDQGTGWTNLTFNDSSWVDGPAQLGYGDNPPDEATVVSFGPDSDNKYVTTYFRRKFTVSNPARVQSLALNLLRDDGAIVFINGQEAWRTNMPAGSVAYRTFASAQGEFFLETTPLPNSLLVAGTNIVAVEMHQGATNSSDMSFELELSAVMAGTGNNPPGIAITNPANGAGFTVPATVNIEASASDTDGTISKVEFFQNGVKLGEDAAAPYAFTWSNVPEGIYALTAVATDSGGALATSAPVSITATSTTVSTNALISLGSTWKYLDDGSDQGTDWIQFAFDDSTWSNGVAQLGYGDGDEATLIGFGPNAADKYVTTYFRRKFVVEDLARVQSLSATLLRDDGGAVYLNGQEAWRIDLAPGAGYRAYALNAADYGPDSTNLAASFLVQGTNVVAVEMHQGNAGSSDVSFDFALNAVISAPTNFSPVVTLTSPPNNTTLAAPANVTLTAVASDQDGTVTNVAFFANGSKLADDTVAAYSFAWNGVTAGNYSLVAIATDDVGLVSTSAVVNLTVSTDTAPPVISNKTPAPGSVTNLTEITVTFSKTVVGVDAGDLLVNGAPATSIIGGGAVYTFAFLQPAYGTVSISWNASHGIGDVFTPPHPFNANGAGATWQYQLLDAVPPLVSAINPVPGSTIAALTSISAIFSESVTGVNAADLRINGVAASTISGSGAGPYVFGFPQPAEGTVQVNWASGHGIQDSAANPFAGGAWSYSLDTNASGVVISEIMYHPSSENVLEEYVELHNKGASPVSLAGWRFTQGVQYTFPAVSIAAGGYLVVAADLPAFAAKYPGVSNVIGPWTGFLNNSSEDIELEDAQGERVDIVEYADEGDWAVRRRGRIHVNHRGWVWFAEHDGLGKSLELINPQVSNDSGQNWASSAATNGTPGAANSVLSNNIAPLILDATHFPIIPTSINPVLISAQIRDETAGGLSVTLFYRTSSPTPPAFSALIMRDDGSAGDPAAADGRYSALIGALPNASVIEWYIAASDQAGNTRTWPAAAIPAEDQSGAPSQSANALYQVDDSNYTGSQPIYRFIMTEPERNELHRIPQTDANSDAQMNGTFISIDGGGTELRYLAGFRNRGHGSRGADPPNYRINFRSDDDWKSVTALNLNTRQVHVQHLGSVLARKSGAAGANTIAVQVRVNSTNRANAGAPMYGSYAANEALNGDWADNHFPLDGNGNIYRAIRDIAPPDFSYRGENPTSYQNTWFKESNVSEDDWTDLVGMLRVVGINNVTSFTTENVRQVVNVEQWLRHLAVMNLFGNSETGLNSGYNDDYFMYRGVNDPRFMLIYYDLDQILGQGGSFPPTEEIFSATRNNGSGLAFDRLMHWPDFEPIYYQILHELLETTFAQSNFNALVDQTLGSYASAVTGPIKNWMNQRRAHVLSVLPALPNTRAAVASISGVPRSPTPLTSASLTIGGEGVTHYRYRLNGGAYSAERAVATSIVLSALANGTNTVAVIGRGTNNVWQAESSATIRSWVVNTSWPAVRINEVLAENDTAYSHFSSFPDYIELFNEGSTTVNLSAYRLTDDPANPNKFSFPPGTSLASGAYLVIYANEPDGTPGLHAGFRLNKDGDGVYLFDRATNGNIVLDSVVFGMQLVDLSIGRVSGGDYILTQPTHAANNTALPVSNPRDIKINEWLTAGFSPYPFDYVELYNTGPLPVSLGGLHLTDEPIGAPARHRIPSLTFIAGDGWIHFVADGDAAAGPNHLEFRLAVEQGEIGLFAADLSLIDCVTYGPQQADVARGRCPDGALRQTTLSFPTPGGPNACPFTPPPPILISLTTISNTWRYEESGVDLGTNWLRTNFDDSSWSEGLALLARETAPLPEPIRTTLTTSNGKWTFYFRTHFNVAPNVNASALDITHIIDDGMVVYLNGEELYRFNMPGGTISYTTPAGGIGDATYQGPFRVPATNLLAGDNLIAVEVHQNTAGSGDVVFGLRLDAVIVTNSPVLAGLVINEVLANNATLEEPNGSKPDWVEIYNPSADAVDLANMSLTDVITSPRRWVFPAGSVLPARETFAVRFDPDTPSSMTNTGFGLKSAGGSVYLFHKPSDGGTIASSITYGFQAADWSIGRVPDGGSNWVLTIPTIGETNQVASLGDPAALKANEWMAANSGGADWFEIYNPNPQPVDMSRMYLSDRIGEPLKHVLPVLCFIGVGPFGYQKFDAGASSPEPGAADQVPFALSASQEWVVLSSPDGSLINLVEFEDQQPGVSEGCLPDGSPTITTFPTTSTPGAGNFLPLDSIVINELLSHSELPLEDAVELYNTTGDDVTVTGWYLSDSKNNLLKFRITTNAVVPAGGYLVLYEYQFNADTLAEPFSFSSARGDEVYLSEASAPGVLTGYRAFAEFGPQEDRVSFGRFVTSGGVDFPAMSARSFGADTPATVEIFRTGTGRTNPYPKVGPIVINEVMYHPSDENDTLEYVELHNILGSPVQLFDPANPQNTWRMRKGVDFNFPEGTVIPAGGFLVLVSFNPLTDPVSLAAFHSAYGTNATLMGPYSGRLDNGGEAIQVQKPDMPVTEAGPDFGLVPYVVVDRIRYADLPPWPVSPDGFGDTLARISQARYGNDPANWVGASPTVGAPNFSGGINAAPVLEPIGNRAVNEQSLLSFTATATDADTPAQTVTFSLDDAPAGASITPGGAFTWTPTEFQGPGVYNVTVRVTDSGSPVLSDAETILITVNEVNAAPFLNPIGNKIADEGTLITFTADASDADVPAQTLTYALEGTIPSGVTFDANTGAFTWTPAEAQGPGSYPLTVRVTDNGSPTRSDSEAITITVNEVNSPPVITGISRSLAGEVTINWQSVAGETYRVQHSSDLVGWNDLAPLVTATGPSASFSHNPLSQQGFYRVLLVN